MAVSRSPAKKNAGKLALAQRIFEGMCREITTGKLKPGELLSRRRIAERYGASYTPVIEAMLRLEHAGLIEAVASQMARVRRVSVETIQSNYVLREAYETQAIRLACERATADEIAELYRRAEEVDARRTARDAAGRDDPDGLLLHWHFHKRLAELSRVPALVEALEHIQLLRQLQANWHYVPSMAGLPRWHSLLVDAIAQRDPQAADAAMRTHVRRGLEKELLGCGITLPR
jgi:DNA-binding GntR family transcriptional regulator